MASVPILPLSAEDEARFWSFVIKGPGCWAWRGTIRDRSERDGRRGSFSASCKSLIAPRVAWALTNGRDPDGMVCHSCDNPNCVNPDHLFEGDAKINAEDMSRKGRVRNKYGQNQTHCIHGHEFTPENTRMKGKNRICRACHRRWCNERRRKSSYLSTKSRKFMCRIAKGVEYRDDQYLSGPQRMMVYRLVERGMLALGASESIQITDAGRAALNTDTPDIRE